MLLENNFELLALFGGCGYAGLTLFGVNTGLRGEVLAGVLNQSRARLLVVDERFWPEVERVRGELTHIAAENILVLRTGSGDFDRRADLGEGLEREVRPAGGSLDAPPVEGPAGRHSMGARTCGPTGR